MFTTVCAASFVFVCSLIYIAYRLGYSKGETKMALNFIRGNSIKIKEQE
jgi:hypothetical protein